MQLSRSNSVFEFPLPSTRPYAPRWLDCVTKWIGQQPGPATALYIALAVLLNLLNAALEWRTGSYPAGTFSPLHVVAITTGIYYLALIQYLDLTARRTLAKFRPALDVCDEDFLDLLY